LERNGQSGEKQRRKIEGLSEEVIQYVHNAMAVKHRRLILLTKCFNFLNVNTLREHQKSFEDVQLRNSQNQQNSDPNQSNISTPLPQEKFIFLRNFCRILKHIFEKKFLKIQKQGKKNFSKGKNSFQSIVKFRRISKERKSAIGYQRGHF
jgi:hypothetical protein